MEENKNVEKKKPKALLVIIIAILFLGLGLGIGYYLFNNKESKLDDNTNEVEKDEGSKEEKEDEKEKEEKEEEEEEDSYVNEPVDDSVVSDELLKELKSIADIDHTDPYDEWFHPLMFNDGVINNYDTTKKTHIVYRYAIKNKMASSVQAGSQDYCTDGGVCTGVKISDFKEICKKYGITEFVPNTGYGDFKKYNEMYWGDLGGSTVNYSETSHDINALKTGDEIILTDNMTFKGGSGGDKNVTKEFTFKRSAATNDYYLYSVATK